MCIGRSKNGIMNVSRLMTALALIFCMLVVIPEKATQGATKPAKPVIALEQGQDGASVKVTIKKTERADGYLIYMKSDTATKYKKVKALKKSGNAERSYTIKNLSEGKYSFKVRAYVKEDGKAVKGAYSKAKSITLTLSSNVSVQSDVEISKKYFPDSNFRAYVSENFDTNKNGKLSKEEMQSVKNIDCSDMNIASLEGIAFFDELCCLTCYRNPLALIDVSRNTKLTELYCGNNYFLVDEDSYTRDSDLFLLKNLDVSHNKELKRLQCVRSEVHSIIFGDNTELEYLNVFDTALSELDLKTLVNLKELLCSNTPLTSLDLSHNKKLEILNCSNNDCTYYFRAKSLDLSQNVVLRELSCNSVTELDISNNTALEKLDLSDNEHIKSVDVTGLFALEYIWKNDYHGITDNEDGELNIEIIDKTPLIPINEENFPNSEYRRSLLEYCDRDNDGMLSRAEIASSYDDGLIKFALKYNH